MNKPPALKNIIKSVHHVHHLRKHMQSKNEFISDLSVVAFTVPSPQECVAAIRIKDPAVVGFLTPFASVVLI